MDTSASATHRGHWPPPHADAAQDLPALRARVGATGAPAVLGRAVVLSGPLHRVDNRAGSQPDG